MENAEQVFRILHKQTGEFLPAPRNAMGVYATKRGAKAGLTQFGHKLNRYRRRNESTDDYEVVPFYLVRAVDDESE